MSKANGTIGIVSKPPPRNGRKPGGGGIMFAFCEAAMKAKIGEVITYGKGATGQASSALVAIEVTTGRRFAGYSGPGGIQYHERIA